MIVFGCTAKIRKSWHSLQVAEFSLLIKDMPIRFHTEGVAVELDIEHTPVKAPVDDPDELRVLWWPYYDLNSNAVS